MYTVTLEDHTLTRPTCELNADESETAKFTVEECCAETSLSSFQDLYFARRNS